jgi:26S proteasome regulatory subunit N2
MDVEETPEAGEKKEDEKMDVEKDEADKKPVKKKREPEPTQFRVGNPFRITTAQSKVCEFDLTQRYRPIRPEDKPFGVIVLTDSTPGEKEDLGAVKAPSLEPEGELAPPEPFEWTPPSEDDSPKSEEEKSSDADNPMSDDTKEEPAEA